MGYHKMICRQLEEFGTEVVNAGMVDSPDSARATSDLFKTSNIEIIFLFTSTYALSSTVLPVVQRFNVLVVILNLQLVPAIDYEKFN